MTHAALESTLVLETFNILEGVPLSELWRALDSARAVAGEHGEIEILVAEVSGDAELKDEVGRWYPEVRLCDYSGLDYGQAKARAARDAKGTYVLYLDSDCVPLPGWYEALVGPLRRGEAAATGGFTTYGPGALSRLKTLCDFGFLLPRTERPLGCYASNNSAFLRDLLLEVPEPEGPMRCRCYAHAQALARLDRPVRLIPAAEVRHLPTGFWSERIRQGYDMVAACWVDPELPEAPWASRGLLALPYFYARRLRLDWSTLWRFRRDAGFSLLGAACASLVLPLWRGIDALGSAAALRMGPAAQSMCEGGPARPQGTRDPG